MIYIRVASIMLTAAMVITHATNAMQNPPANKTYDQIKRAATIKSQRANATQEDGNHSLNANPNMPADIKATIENNIIQQHYGAAKAHDAAAKAARDEGNEAQAQMHEARAAQHNQAAEQYRGG